MATSTPNYALVKPAYNEWADITVLNNNLDIIDTQIFAKASKTRQIIAGLGLTGGGDLTTDRTLNIASANDGIIANADNIQLDTQNVLTSTAVNKPLSANMGKELQDTKLNLTGGTLTGALNGTTATFSGDITAPNLAVFSTLDKTSLISGTTYTNTTGKPMMITAREANQGAAAGRGISIAINGEDVSSVDDSANADLCVTAICPANGTYMVFFWGTLTSRTTIRQY